MDRARLAAEHLSCNAPKRNIWHRFSVVSIIPAGEIWGNRRSSANSQTNSTCSLQSMQIKIEWSIIVSLFEPYTQSKKLTHAVMTVMRDLVSNKNPTPFRFHTSFRPESHRASKSLRWAGRTIKLNKILWVPPFQVERKTHHVSQ